MNKKFVKKFTAVVSAVCMISVGIASVNAAEIDDGFESVTKNAQSSDSSFRLHIPQSAIRLLTKTDFRVISAQKNSAL